MPLLTHFMHHYWLTNLIYQHPNVLFLIIPSKTQCKLSTSDTTSGLPLLLLFYLFHLSCALTTILFATQPNFLCTTSIAMADIWKPFPYKCGPASLSIFNLHFNPTPPYLHRYLPHCPHRSYNTPTTITLRLIAFSDQCENYDSKANSN